MPWPKQSRGQTRVAPTCGWQFDASVFAFVLLFSGGFGTSWNRRNVSYEWRRIDWEAGLFDRERLRERMRRRGAEHCAWSPKIRDKLIQTSAWSLLNRSYK